jgi:hypothetical protein
MGISRKCSSRYSHVERQVQGTTGIASVCNCSCHILVRHQNNASRCADFLQVLTLAHVGTGVLSVNCFRTVLATRMQYAADPCSPSGGSSLQAVAHTKVTTIVLLGLQQALQWRMSLLRFMCASAVSVQSVPCVHRARWGATLRQVHGSVAPAALTPAWGPYHSASCTPMSRHPVQSTGCQSWAVHRFGSHQPSSDP